MLIEQTFPFSDCDSCEDCVLDVDETVIYADDSVATRKLCVGCRNSNLCIKQRRKGSDHNV